MEKEVKDVIICEECNNELVNSMCHNDTCSLYLKEIPQYEPECLSTSDNDSAECEFSILNGNWWCITHSCNA